MGAAAALTACTFSGSLYVNADDVAEQVANELEQAAGSRPEVECAENLPAKVEETIDCEVQDGPDTYPATVTVTEVEGSGVAFDIQVTNTPLGE